MKKNFTLTFALLLCLFYIGGNAQTQFWSDTFEDAGAPSSGARTPSIAEFTCAGPPATSYFTRTTGVPSISLQNNGAANYASIQGTKFWALEDIDRGPTCTANSIPASQQITWSGINITGKSGLSFRGLFAADHIGAWQGSNFGTAQDFLAFEYRINGGAWTKGIVFYANLDPGDTGSSGQLYLETTGDLKGDGPGLTYTLTEYTANIVGTGTTLDIRMNCHANGSTSQEMAIDNFRLFETPPCVPINGTTVVTNVACNGGTTGAINLTPTGGTGPYTFNWGGGITTEDRTGLAAGTYSVTITDANSCTGTVSGITVTQPTAVNGSTVVTNVACNGGNTGAINLTPTGGTGPYTFNWGGGITTEDRTGLAVGTYSVTITDANSCTGTVSGITVTQPTAVVSGTTIVTNVTCNAGTNGVIDLTPTGGTSPYTYNWGGGITTQDRISLAAGTYSVTITDANGCTGTVSGITVTQPTAVNGSTVVTNVACNGGNTGAINLTPSGGTPGYTFNWGGGITTEDRTGLAAGTYSVTITDANGCTRTVSGITVTQPTAAVSGTTVVTNVSCFGGSNGAINLTPTGGTGPYTFNWGGGVTTEDRTGLVAGTYSVTITDANGCTGTVSPTVTQPAATVSGTTVVTNIACFGGTTGSINLTPTGGTGPYTFNWGGGVTTEDRTGLAAGTYSVTITDANGCTGTVSPTVTQPAATVSGTTVVTNIACFGGTTGSINLTPTGGTGPYTFNWGGGITTEDRTGLAAGTYSVTITDANGCTGTVSPTVTQPAATVSGTTVVTNISCIGNTTGAINLTPTGGTGPYTFNWGGGITTEDRTGLAAGTYSVTITDINGCTGTVSGITVTQPAAPISGTINITNVSCFGGNNGALNLTTTGGTGPYTFDWGGGITTEDRTGLAAGSYSVTITDANGCTAGPIPVTVTQPAAAVSGTTVVTNVSCFGGNNGAINLTPTGGTGPYTFNWGGGITTEDRTGLAAGTYSVTITDANGCTGTVSPTVTQPAAAVSGTTVVTNIACFGGNTGSINLTPTGGVGPYTFNWGGGITTEDRTGLAAGTYSVTITDANGCTGTVSPTVTQPAAAVSGTTVVTNIACFGGNTGSINLTPTGGTGPYTFNWGGGITTEDRTGLAAGTYSVTITDANGCTGTVSPTVTQPAAAVSGTTVVTNIACFGGNTGSINLTPTGGVGPYTFNWGGGITTEDRTGLAAGTYSVTITDANGCTGTVSPTVTQPSALVVTPNTQTNVSCNGGSNGAAAINTPTGGAGGYTYDWTPGTPTGDGTTSVTGLSAGTYTVTVTDANGCTATQSFTVTAPLALVVTPSSQTNVACNGGSNGAAAINTPTGGAGGYTYDWTPGTPTGDGTTSVTGLSAGTYTVTVTDANGCTATQSFTITAPTAINTATGSQTNVSCNGGTNGSASVTPSGGTPGYTYSWAPSGGTADTATGLAAGTYTVTITDANGCTATRSYTITEPTSINTATGSQTNVACNGGTNGSATVAPTGGTPGYTYSWAPSGGTAATATGLTAGTYTVTVTDANGCIATRSYTITEPAAIDATVSLAGETLTANQAGATYQWFECPNTLVSGQTGQSFTPTVSGDYRVTVTLGGCSVDSSCQTVLGADSFEANKKFLMYPNPSKGTLSVEADFDGDLQIVNQLGQTVRTFKVNMNNINTVDLGNLTDGIYFVLGANQTKIATQKLIIKK